MYIYQLFKFWIVGRTMLEPLKVMQKIVEKFTFTMATAK